jgi:NAD(P)-dependent dehydrogenase (short-subunit alcohol dehydrogenase family)
MKVAVISGGAGGLGRALSSSLQDRGWMVIALDLDISGLVASPTLQPLQCDLTNSDALADCAAQIIKDYPEIKMVIYNAGITQIEPFDQSEDASHRKVFDINYFAAVSMARHFLEAVRKGRGVHLAISSVAGFTPLYHRTSYAASKHALEGFFKSLRSEEKVHGVGVHIAAPSFVATNIGNAQRQPDGIARPGSADDGKDYMTPDAAAAEILKGLDRGRPMILVGRIAHLAWWINRLSPALFQKLMERQISGHNTSK